MHQQFTWGTHLSFSSSAVASKLYSQPLESTTFLSNPVSIQIRTQNIKPKKGILSYFNFLKCSSVHFSGSDRSIHLTKWSASNSTIKTSALRLSQMGVSYPTPSRSFAVNVSRSSIDIVMAGGMVNNNVPAEVC